MAEIVRVEGLADVKARLQDLPVHLRKKVMYAVLRKAAVPIIKAAKANMMSTTIGHIHSHAGINYIANIDKLIFAFNVGCLIDKSAYAFGYGKHIKAKPILGCGLIEHDVPYFVPMMLNKAGRWVQ